PAGAAQPPALQPRQSGRGRPGRPVVPPRPPGSSAAAPGDGPDAPARRRRGGADTAGQVIPPHRPPVRSPALTGRHIPRAPRPLSRGPCPVRAATGRPGGGGEGALRPVP